MDLAIKIIMLVIFFGSMIGIGIYCRKNSTDVNGFVLGGRNVGPWLTAFAYGTSYSPQLYLLAMPVNLVGNTEFPLHGQVWAMPSSVLCWHGQFSAGAPVS